MNQSCRVEMLVELPYIIGTIVPNYGGYLISRPELWGLFDFRTVFIGLIGHLAPISPQGIMGHLALPRTIIQGPFRSRHSSF